MDPIQPKNLTARLAYRGRGNPPASHPQDVIGNCFPGVELDLRNLWRRLFVGVELHEARVQVTAVDPDTEAARQGLAAGWSLLKIDDQPVGFVGDPYSDNDIDWSNALADVVGKAGKKVKCTFQAAPDGHPLDLLLEVRPLLEGAVIALDAVAPGELTQSLCSPWQYDFRECACYYWAANRPDFVDVDIVDGKASGFNWLQKDRSGAKEYVADSANGAPDPRLLSHDDLYRDWETQLKFQIGGKDAE